MDYPISLSSQLGTHLKSLRKQGGLTQGSLGALLGLRQSRIAEIEANPGAVSVQQWMTILAALGAKMVLRVDAEPVTGVAENVRAWPGTEPPPASRAPKPAKKAAKKAAMKPAMKAPKKAATPPTARKPNTGSW